MILQMLVARGSELEYQFGSMGGYAGVGVRSSTHANNWLLHSTEK